MSKESRIAIAKMNLYSSAFMVHFSGGVILGTLNENWEKGDHVEHSTETIVTQIKMFDRQVKLITQSAEKDDIESLKGSLKIFKDYKKTLENNLQHGKIKIEKDELLQYVKSLNDVITTITTLIKVISEEK